MELTPGFRLACALTLIAVAAGAEDARPAWLLGSRAGSETLSLGRAGPCGSTVPADAPGEREALSV
jgi:hypothetical protein